ncbi:RIP metalloprotease RseP [Undibacterium sp. SXout7W]|uniref:RIP metalloprotease RseP n=1 Tax=Undibacterium sp. SXout7W TaxID=3413049 RepID=UPI003BF3DA29
MMLIQTLLAFLVALGTLVTIHEFGHYLAARWCGVKVLRFSIGMGKVIFSRQWGKDKTEWAISALPLGGYVKMLDIRESGSEQISEQDLPREFCRQPAWKRMVIVAAGPFANFLLAIILYAALFMHGISEPVAKIRVPSSTSIAYQVGLRQGDLIQTVDQQTVQSWSDLRWKLMQKGLDKADVELGVQRLSSEDGHALQQRVISLPLKQLTTKDLEGDFFSTLGFSLARPPAFLEEVAADGPAMKAGLLAQDQILEVDHIPLLDALSFTEIVNASAGKSLKLLVKRGQEAFDVDVTPVADVVNEKTIGRLKVKLSMAPDMQVVSAPFFDAIVKASHKTFDTSMMSLKMLGKMIVGDVSLKNITGPLTIADYAGQTSRTSAVSYLSFIALISISLGVMNLLPIPVLDGGHLLYYSLEVLTGKRVPERVGEIAQRIGVTLLMTLMAIAFFNDIVRLMS